MAEKKAASDEAMDTKAATGADAPKAGEPTDAQKADGSDRVTRKFSDKERSSEGSPLATSGPKFGKPGPDVSHADLDLQALSLDARDSTYHPNPDPNPNNERPAPGPSTVQVLGTPKGD